MRRFGRLRDFPFMGSDLGFPVGIGSVEKVAARSGGSAVDHTGRAGCLGRLEKDATWRVQRPRTGIAVVHEQGLGRQQHARHEGRVLERGAHDPGGSTIRRAPGRRSEAGRVEAGRARGAGSRAITCSPSAPALCAIQRRLEAGERASDRPALASPDSGNESAASRAHERDAPAGHDALGERGGEARGARPRGGVASVIAGVVAADLDDRDAAPSPSSSSQTSSACPRSTTARSSRPRSRAARAPERPRSGAWSVARQASASRSSSARRRSREPGAAPRTSARRRAAG